MSLTRMILYHHSLSGYFFHGLLLKMLQFLVLQVLLLLLVGYETHEVRQRETRFAGRTRG